VLEGSPNLSTRSDLDGGGGGGCRFGHAQPRETAAAANCRITELGTGTATAAGRGLMLVQQQLKTNDELNDYCGPAATNLAHLMPPSGDDDDAREYTNCLPQQQQLQPWQAGDANDSCNERSIFTMQAASTAALTTISRSDSSPSSRDNDPQLPSSSGIGTIGAEKQREITALSDPPTSLETQATECPRRSSRKKPSYTRSSQ